MEDKYDKLMLNMISFLNTEGTRANERYQKSGIKHHPAGKVILSLNFSQLGVEISKNMNISFCVRSDFKQYSTSKRIF